MKIVFFYSTGRYLYENSDYAENSLQYFVLFTFVLVKFCIFSDMAVKFKYASSLGKDIESKDTHICNHMFPHSQYSLLLHSLFPYE